MRYDDFADTLDKDLGWRKKEISDLFFIIQQNNSEVLFKSMILLLYAHWEGFIKRSSKLYLKYISDKNILVDSLSMNFKAILMKHHVRSCISQHRSSTIDTELSFIEVYRNKNKKFRVKVDLENNIANSLIDTEHNLKGKIFQRILKTLGLEYKPVYQTKKQIIDRHLLANRNCIGHGDSFDDSEENFSLSLRDIDKLKSVILKLIDSFRDDLLEYSFKEYYLKSNNDERLAYEKARESQLGKEFSAIDQRFL